MDGTKVTTKVMAVWYGLAALLFAGGVFSRGTAHDFYDVASKAAELAVLAAGLFSVLLIRDQLIAQKKQLEDNHQQMVDDHKWKTIVSYHQLFSGGVPDENIRKPMYDLATQCDFIDCFDDLGAKMPTAVFDKCVKESELRQVIRPYLDEFEKFCGAVNSGIVNEVYALSLQGTRIIRNYTVFEDLIKHFQRGNGLAYVELEKLATKWAMKRRVDHEANVFALGVGSGTDTKIRSPK